MDRKIIQLNEGWKFHYGNCEEAWYKGFDDSTSDWKNVYIPHDWSVSMPFLREYSSGTGYLAGGIGWYRVRFKLPEEYRGKSIKILFDGVYKNSMVWCNSYYLGKHPYGYTPFSYNISDRAVFGDEENEISVKVCHEDISDSRWFTGNGITRKVSIIVEEPAHPGDFGVFFKTESVTDDHTMAKIGIRHRIETAVSGTLLIENRIIDDKGECVCVLKDEVQLKAGEKSKVWLRGSMKNPHLWSDKDPYLYHLESWYTLEDSKGGAYLADSAEIGVRDVKFDPDKGLFINGSSVKLKGVCVHHDGGCLGAAMKQEIWQRRLEMLKEAGCNAIRCSHNPHMPELYDLCDRMGFYMMDEAFDEWENPKNKWHQGHNVYPPKHQGYYEDFPEWHEKDLEAMVRRDRNHPSVILYSIGNEVDYPNDPYCHPMFQTMTGNNDANKPEAEQQYDANKPNMERLAVIAKKLTAIVKKADDSRPVTVAAAFPELSTYIGFIDGLDVVGYNYKEHLYKQDHERFPDKTFLGSENGHSYEAWRAVTDNDYICGQFLWTGIDYLGEAHGWPVHGSTAGILSTAGLPKPDFYRRKTFWSDDPTICIMTRRASDGDADWLPMANAWDYTVGQEIIIKVYVTDSLLNQNNGIPAVEIYLKGEKKAESESRTADNAFEFRLPFEKGVLMAKARNVGVSLETTLVTPARELELEEGKNINEGVVIETELWKNDDVITGENFEEASNHIGYLYQVHVTAKDTEGNILRNAIPVGNFFVARDRDASEFMNFETGNPKFMDYIPDIYVSTEGSGEIAGIDSGNLSDTVSFTSNRRKFWNGEAVVYVRRTAPGEIKLLINGEESIIL